MTKSIETLEEYYDDVEREILMDEFQRMSEEDKDDFLLKYPREEMEIEQIISLEGKGCEDFLKDLGEFLNMGIVNKEKFSDLSEDFQSICGYSEEESNYAAKKCLEFD